MTMTKDGSTTFKKFAYHQYIPNCSLYKGFWIIRIQVSKTLIFLTVKLLILLLLITI